MPQSHDTLSGHGLIRGGSAQLGFLLGEFHTEAFRSERFRSCDEWIFEVNFRQAGLSSKWIARSLPISRPIVTNPPVLVLVDWLTFKRKGDESSRGD